MFSDPLLGCSVRVKGGRVGLGMLVYCPGSSAISLQGSRLCASWGTRAGPRWGAQCDTDWVELGWNLRMLRCVLFCHVLTSLCFLPSPVRVFTPKLVMPLR